MAYTLRFVPDLELEQYLPNVVRHGHYAHSRNVA